MASEDTRYLDRGLVTNAGKLNEGDPLTREQIDALAEMENEFCESRLGWASIEKTDAVLHAFICHALGECVCPVTKEVKP